MLEALLQALHPRWHATTEVAVRRPSRGWIDAVLHEPRERLAVASELQSELRRLEQLVRWSADKAASLPSWEGWASMGEDPRIERLLLVRRTRATRAVAAEFSQQVHLAYPAHPTMRSRRSPDWRRGPGRRSCGRSSTDVARGSSVADDGVRQPSEAASR